MKFNVLARVKREVPEKDNNGDEEDAGAGAGGDFGADSVRGSVSQMRRQLAPEGGRGQRSQCPPEGEGKIAERDLFIVCIVSTTLLSYRYGLQPKFIRMRELHLLLFYLTRDYDGGLREDGAEAAWEVARQCGSACDPKLVSTQHLTCLK